MQKLLDLRLHRVRTLLCSELADPIDGSVQDVVTINNRGFVDVAFTPPSYAGGVDIDSVIDLAPEVILSTLDGTSIAVDTTQAAAHLRSEAGGVEVFRIWFVGEFDGSVVADNVTVEFIAGSFDWTGTDGGTLLAVSGTNEISVNAVTSGANVVVNFSLGDTQTLDIASVEASDFTFITSTGTSVAFDSITERGPPGEFSLVFAGGAGVSAGDAGTLSFSAGACCPTSRKRKKNPMTKKNKQVRRKLLPPAATTTTKKKIRFTQ